MTLFTLLLVLLQERLFKFGQLWQLDHRIEPLLRSIKQVSLLGTLTMTALVIALAGLIEHVLTGWFYNVPLLLLWIILGSLCIGAGPMRRQYHQYLEAARQGDENARDAMSHELTLIHGVPPEGSHEQFLRELQNALLWINYRFYLAPLLWFVFGGFYGPALLMGYAFLRAWQTWLARHHSVLERAQSGVDRVLHVVDWVPVRLVGLGYALLGHGEKALPAWFASLSDGRTAQHQILTQLAQFSLARDPHLDDIQTPRTAVALAKKTTLVIVVVVALLTIYGALL